MAIDVNRLSPDAQRQILRKVQEQEMWKTLQAVPSKYHNVPTVAGGIKHASKREAARYMELLTMYRARVIRDLRIQQDFTLQEAYTTPEGERVRAIRYRADFTYYRATEPDATGTVHWLLVVEDAKGKVTDVYAMKRKMMQERLGITVEEV